MYALSASVAFAEMAGRAADLGFTDVVTHWPRPEDPYAGERHDAGAVAAHGPAALALTASAPGAGDRLS